MNGSSESIILYFDRYINFNMMLNEFAVQNYKALRMLMIKMDKYNKTIAGNKAGLNHRREVRAQLVAKKEGLPFFDTSA